VAARSDLPPDRIAAFCCKWNIAELALFGSVLRDDFAPDSDVDVMVVFFPGGGQPARKTRADAAGATRGSNPLVRKRWITTSGVSASAIETIVAQATDFLNSVPTVGGCSSRTHSVGVSSTRSPTGGAVDV
jgi:hypothetical protein